MWVDYGSIAVFNEDCVLVFKGLKHCCVCIPVLNTPLCQGVHVTVPSRHLLKHRGLCQDETWMYAGESQPAERAAGDTHTHCEKYWFLHVFWVSGWFEEVRCSIHWTGLYMPSHVADTVCAALTTGRSKWLWAPFHSNHMIKIPGYVCKQSQRFSGWPSLHLNPVLLSSCQASDPQAARGVIHLTMGPLYRLR